MPRPKQTQESLALIRPATAMPVTLPQTVVDIVHELPAQILAIGRESDRDRQRDQLRAAKGRCVFAFWVAKFQHPRARLDGVREKVLHARLAEGDDDLSEVLWALEGAYRDDVVMGRKPGFSKNDGIELILRDRAHLERYAERMKGYLQDKPHALATKHFGSLAGPWSDAVAHVDDFPGAAP